MTLSTARRFPGRFLWGVAASAYQVEGGAKEDGRGPSIWDTFSHTAGRTADGATGDVAIDHYHRYRQDVELMAELGVDAYRFSLSWPRLLPDGTGRINQAGVEFYVDLCDALLEAGIIPFVTLYHWDLPQALQDRGGWLEPSSVEWFAEYATVAKEALGDRVKMWSTLNEPWCAAFLGHSSGVFAPGLNRPETGFLAAHHLMLAHNRAVSAMRDVRPHPDDRFGVVLNLIPARPSSPDPADVAVAETVDQIHNEQFLRGILEGSYPPTIRRLQERFGVSDQIDVAELAATRVDLDFLGVNYYNINRFRHDPTATGPPEYPGADGAVATLPPGPLTEMGWGVEPEGLTEVLGRAAEMAPSLPLYVTENGAAYPDEVGASGEVWDDDRIRYLDSHISAVADALDRGVDVRGYFVWSVFDNFEWASGYAIRFGIVRVDYETLERTVKKSGWWYRDLIASRHRARGSIDQ